MTTESVDLTDIDRDTWLAMRHPFIGSSDVPTLFGEGYSGHTVHDLWDQKRSPNPPEDKDITTRMWLGQRAQELIGELVERETGWQILPGRELLIDKKKRMCATVDFRVHGLDRGTGLIETKLRDHMSFKQRYQDGLEACIYDRYQLATQMILDQDMSWGTVAVCVGLSKLWRFEYTRKELQPMIDEIEQGVAGFWHAVDNDVEPPIVADDLPGFLSEHAGGQIKDELQPADLHGLDEVLTKYAKAHDDRKTAEKIEKELKPQIVDAMRDPELGERLTQYGWSNDFLVKLRLSQIAESTRTVKAHVRSIVEVFRRDAFEAPADG